ncbi:MAG: hypothetical protein ACFFAE_13560 [Candidatus Hodarchaeota archaeon]
MLSLSATETSLIWGNLRNLIDFNSITVPSDLCLVSTIPGEFPVYDFHPIFLEIPRSLKKFNMSGRKNFSQLFIDRDLGWRPRRIVSLPNYENDKDTNPECLKSIIQLWEKALIPEEIPCIALGVNITGQNSDGREGQYVTVLLIWANQKTRILELDWFEGPLDDCITPEWYLQVSEIMNVKKGLTKMEKCLTMPSNWENPLFSIYSIPPCLDCSLKNKWEESNLVGWRYKLSYHEYEMCMDALESILTQIKLIFT